MNNPAQIIFASALGASVLIHGMVYSGLEVSSMIVPAQPIQVMPQMKRPPKVTFEFTDAPDDLKDEETPLKQTNKISSKNSSARDLIADKVKSPQTGPAAPVVKDGAQQLAKKNQPDLYIQDKKGAQVPNQDYLTPLDQKLPLEETFEAEPDKKEEAIAEMKKDLISLEKLKKDLDKKLSKKREDLLEKQKKKVQKERTQEMSQTYTPQGNAKQDKRVVVYDPTRNVDTYQAEMVQKFVATAIDIGSPSFSSNKHILGPYLDRLKSRVSPLWHLKLESQDSGRLFNTKKVVIGVQILKDGSLGALLILQDFGDDLFNKLCLDTFIELAPFEFLPTEWKQESGLDHLNLIYRFKAY